MPKRYSQLVHKPRHGRRDGADKVVAGEGQHPDALDRLQSVPVSECVCVCVCVCVCISAM
jgi:hypothetical protein